MTIEKTKQKQTVVFTDVQEIWKVIILVDQNYTSNSFQFLS